MEIKNKEELLLKLRMNVIELSNEYAKKYSSYNVIKLQRDFPTYNQETLFKRGDIIDALVYGDKENYNNSGASLYLIRKSIARKLFEYTIKEKPYWKADYFADFISLVDSISHIAQAEKLLGHIPKYKKISSSPLFSIIIPIYNTSNYLDECLRSVVEQNFDDYEIILVDDGSTDDSFDICANYMKQYGNISLVSKPNGGLSDARNVGIDEAEADLIGFIDSDDTVSSDYVDSFINVSLDADLIIGVINDVYIDEEGSVYKQEVRKYSTNLYGTLREEYYSLLELLRVPVIKLYRKKIIDTYQLRFDETLSVAEDQAFNFSYYRNITSYLVEPKCIYTYYHHKGSNSLASSINEKTFEDEVFKLG